MELLTAAQMRAVERAAMAGGAVTGRDLMDRAGAGVIAAIDATWPELAAAPHRALVLCGPGNNGGDGFVVARLLIGRGWDVTLRLLGDAAWPVTPDARLNADRLLDLVDPVARDPARFKGSLRPDASVDLFVDAGFGTGLTRPIDPEMADSLATAQASARRSVAIDAVSGYCLDSGRWLGPEGNAGRADLTVTFHRPKLGHVIGAHGVAAGRLVVTDIGLEARGTTDVGPRVALVGRDHLRHWPVLKTGGHKYDHGHALVLSGPMGRSGAARLAARGALRAGAGLVTVVAPGSAMLECAAQLTAIMLRRSDGADGLAALLGDPRLNALCLGPGLGVSERTRDLVTTALAAGRATLLDADALTAFAGAPEALFDALHAATVLTPHDGEFARLFPDLAARLAEVPTAGPAFSRLDAAREAAARAGCLVLLKGPDTIIADPSGRAVVHAALRDRAVPWLATAGAGDVLAGIITGLLARGLPPMKAAAAGTWLHAGAALAAGPGLIAEDLPETLPQVLRDLAD